MEPFGPVIPPEGLSTAGRDRVWFSEVQILKISEGERVTYRVCCQKTNGNDDIDKAVQAALETVVQQLTAKASPEA